MLLNLSTISPAIFCWTSPSGRQGGRQRELLRATARPPINHRPLLDFGKPPNRILRGGMSWESDHYPQVLEVGGRAWAEAKPTRRLGLEENG
jgi:hypothetical protein